MNISQAKSWAANILNDAGIPEFRRETASLLAFVLQKETALLIAHLEYELTGSEAAAFEKVVKRRASREPFQYITGRQEFYGLEFDVSPSVLIPRPETEILVEAAIGILSEMESPWLFEIGLGSGCISVSILHAVAGASAVGVDISGAALAVAAKNAGKHNVAGRLTLRVADVYDGSCGKFDMIVSNPPYIPDRHLKSLQDEVGQFEPHEALFGGTDGLSVIRRIVAGSAQFLKPKGYLLVEIGFDQAESVKEMFDPCLWKNVEFLPDLQGIPRIAKARFRR